MLERATPNNPLPVVLMPDGRSLANPSDLELARVSGSPAGADGAPIDLVIVGAGPAGPRGRRVRRLRRSRTLVIDSGGIGGQASSSSMIRNYPGFPRGISGSRLAHHVTNRPGSGARFAFFGTVTDLRAMATVAWSAWRPRGRPRDLEPAR